MKDILITVIVPILTALISYLSARHKANAELQKVKEQQDAEIQKIKEQAKNDIDKIKLEMDKQAELYEKNAQVDITKDIMGQFLNSYEGNKMIGQLFKQQIK